MIMADEIKNPLASQAEGDRTDEGTEYVFQGRSFVTRDERGVRTIHRRGSKVRLSDEQAQRLRAGEKGSDFQRESDLAEEPELIEIAVANEATKPPEDGSEHVTVVANAPRRVRPSEVPTRSDKPVDEARRGTVAKPVSSTAEKRSGSR